MGDESSLQGYLGSRPYPGRGIVLARQKSDVLAVSTFISGRSAESQARKVVRVGNDCHVQPTTNSAEDPLRHYATIAATPEVLFAGNGRHVTTLAKAGLDSELSPEPFLELEYEPDAPIYTPRIVIAANPAPMPDLAIVVIASRGADGRTGHLVKRIVDLDPGQALVVHTYDGNVETPKATGYGATVRLDDQSLTDTIWNALDGRFRVAVATIATMAGAPWAHASWSIRQRAT
jgi:hypothetical protein